MDDFYTQLGLSRNASEKEIRQAYRKLARQHHPDVNSGDPGGEEKFKRINEAYQVLSDADKRRAYDKYGKDWKHADQIKQSQAARGHDYAGWFSESRGNGEVFDLGGISSNDFFSDLLSGFGASRPSTVQYPVEISLEEAYNGALRHLEIPDRAHRSQTKKIEVKIPPGVDNGSRVHITAGKGSTQNIYLQVTVRPHLRFRREGSNLYTEVTVPVADAVLGGEVAVTTLKGKVALTLPSETQNGQTFRLGGQGMPDLINQDSKGDLYATVKVVLPEGLTDKERQLFNELKELRSTGR